MYLRYFFSVSAVFMLTVSPFLSLSALAAMPSPIAIGEVAWAGSSLSTSDEWVELWNTSDTSVSVGGWSIHGAGESNKTIFLPSDATIPAQSTYILSNYSSADTRSASTLEPNVVTTTISLSNTSFSIELRTSNGELIDTTGPSSAPHAGISLPIKTSMIRSGDTWISATSSRNIKASITDLATPGFCDGCTGTLNATTSASGTTPDAAQTTPSSTTPISNVIIEELPSSETTSTATTDPNLTESGSVSSTRIVNVTPTATSTENGSASTSTNENGTTQLSGNTTTSDTTNVSTTSATTLPLQNTTNSTQLSVSTSASTASKPSYGLLRLNEISSYPSAGKEWIEITTLDAGNAINLEGCTIHDAKGKILTIKKASIDPSVSRFVVFTLSSAHLNNAGDSVSLYDPSGQPIDTMTYGKTTKDSVWIRHPDITGSWQQSLKATPGVANTFVAPPSEEKKEEIIPFDEELFRAQQEEDAREKLDLEGSEGNNDASTIDNDGSSTSTTSSGTKTATKSTKTTTTTKKTTPIYSITFDMISNEALTALRVLLHGTVATPPGFFSNRTFVLQAPDGRGILVTAPVNQRLPELGKAISAIGTIKFNAANIPSLQIGAKDRWTTSGTSTESIAPRLVDLLAPSTEDAWSLMHVTGTVSDVKGKTIYLDLDDAEVQVVLRPNVNYRAERLKPKDIIAVTGVVDTSAEVPKIMPRSANEIRLVFHPEEPSAANTAQTTKGPTIPNWAPLGAAGGAIAVTEGAKRLHRRHKQKKLERTLVKTS